MLPQELRIHMDLIWFLFSQSIHILEGERDTSIISMRFECFQGSGLRGAVGAYRRELACIESVIWGNIAKISRVGKPTP